MKLLLLCKFNSCASENCSLIGGYKCEKISSLNHTVCYNDLAKGNSVLTNQNVGISGMINQEPIKTMEMEEYNIMEEPK